MIDNVALFICSVFKRKYVPLLIVLFSLSSLLIIILTSFYSSLSTSIKELDKVKDFKVVEIEVKSDKDIKVIDNNQHVINKYEVYAYNLPVRSPKFKTEFLTGEFMLYAIKNLNEVEIINGVNVTPNKVEMICPLNFIPTTKKITSLDYIPFDMREFVDKTIPVYYDNELYGQTQTTRFKLTGIYNNNKFVNDETICYVEYNTLKNLTEDIYPIETNNILIELDSVQNKESVLKYLEDNNINYKNISWLDLDFYRNVLDLNIVFIIIFSCVLLAITYLLMNIIFNKNKNTLVLYYRLGYSIDYIVKLYFYCNMGIWVISLSATTLITLLYDSFKTRIGFSFPLLTQSFTIVVNIKTVVYICFLTLMVNLICTLVKIGDMRRNDI